MQMHRWLTHVEPEDEEVSHSPIRPRASVWIDPVVQHNISASYMAKEQHEIPNPQTPIPARASAQQAAHAVKVRPRYSRNYTVPQESDVTRVPTLPQPTMWQYKLLDYEAESSLSSLSLAYSEATVGCALDEIDTLPPPRLQVFDDIDEIDTVSPPKQNILAAEKSPTTIERKKARGSVFSFPFAQPTKESERQKSVTLHASNSISDVATIPPGATTVAVPRVSVEKQKFELLAKVPALATIVQESSSKLVEASWTTGQGKNSVLAKRIASRGQRKSALSLNPIDRLRWWLLYPGRMEFLLWLSGTIILVGVTCLLLFATLLSTGWLNTGLSSINVSRGTIQTSSTLGHTAIRGKSSCTVANVASPQCHTTTVVSSSGLQLTLVDDALLLPDMPIYLHGQGFTANNTVNFTYDASLPCHPNIMSTDTQGSFSLYLMLDGGVKTGIHHIVAYDVATRHAVIVDVSISPSPMGKATQSTPTHTVPSMTPTSTSGTGGVSGGGFPTPVSQAPVPITPTVGATPTVISTKQPTPTIGITPSPTIGMTPTAGIAPTPTSTTTSTGGTKYQESASTLKDALYDEYVDDHISISMWLWIAVLGYTLAVVMLGCAGLLYRRNRRISSR